MPVAAVERRVEVSDQPGRGEVEFHLAEQFGKDERPELARRQRFGGRGCLRELLALIPPTGWEQIVLVDAVLVGFT